MPDLRSAEQGLMVAERASPPTTPDMASFIRQEAQKALVEGKAQKALENLKSPGKLLKEAEARQQAERAFKPDDVNASGNQDRTNDQKDRQRDAEDIASAIAQNKTKGFDNVTGVDRTGRPLKSILLNTVTDALADHPLVQAIARKNGMDTTNPVYRTWCKTTALHLLRNPDLADKMIGSLADVLATGTIDYKTLQQHLENRRNLGKEIADLKAEIGSGTGPGASGLTGEVAKQEDTVKKYQTKITPGPAGAPPVVTAVVPGSEAQLKMDAQGRLGTYDYQIRLYHTTAQQVDNFFKKNNSATASLDINDPANPANVLTIDRSNWASILTGWDAELKSLQGAQQQDTALIQKIDQDEIAAKQKLEELKQKLEQKKNLLLEKEKNNKDLSKTIDREREVDEPGTVANQEKQIVDRLRDVISQEALNLWGEGVESVTSVEPDINVKMEQTIHEEAIKTLRKNLDIKPGSKEMNKAVMQSNLDTLLSQGVEQYGLAKLRVLWIRAKAPGGPPELKKLVPLISEMVDFNGPTPVIKNQDKFNSFAADVSKELLKVVAYKDPKKLQQLFEKDQLAIASLTGDVLPNLIIEAQGDSSIKAELEKYVGKDITKKSLAEKLRGFDWKKLLIILGILLAAGITFGALKS